MSKESMCEAQQKAMREALLKAVKVTGGQKRLGEACGAKQQHVWNWLNRDKQVPAEYVLPIERATNGQVTRHELRPDIYPEPSPGSRPTRKEATHDAA